MSTYSNCVRCNAPMDSDSRFCSECGAPVPKPVENYCTNPDCINSRRKTLLEENVKYCKYCGKPTTLGAKIKDMI